MSESARKGSEDEEALCCSFTLCFFLLAEPNLHTYLNLTQLTTHLITFNRELHP